MLKEDVLKRINSGAGKSGLSGWIPLKKDRAIDLTYRLDDLARARFRSVQKSCEGLAASRRVWLVHECEKPDWKVNAGTLRVTGRQRIRAGLMEVPGIRTNLEIWGLDTGDRRLFFFPDRMLMYEGSSYRTFEYSALDVAFSPSRFVEEQVPRDAEVVGHTWRHTNADGSPDEHRRRNPRIPIAVCGHLRVSFADGPSLRLQVSDASAGLRFARALGFEQRKKPQNRDKQDRKSGATGSSSAASSNPFSDITAEGARRILGVGADASMREIVTAYRRMARRFHPDKVATMAVEVRESAERRMKEINTAYEALKRHAV